jgi:hypothetical protein
MNDYSYTPQSFTVQIPSSPLYCNHSVELIIVPINTSPWLVASVDTSFKTVIIPPYKSPKTYSIRLYSNFTGCLSHVFTEPGTHRIEVCLNGVQITGSPLSVVVYPHSIVPVPRWQLGTTLLNGPTSSLIEAYYQKDHAKASLPEIQLDSYKWSLDFRNGKATRKNWFSINVEENLVRCIWFWTDDKDQLVPYPPREALVLESGFIQRSEDKVDVNDNVKNKLRWVKKEGGEFRQYRLKYDAKKDGRRVYRGYYGKCLDLSPMPLFWPFKRVLLRGWKDTDCILNKLSKTIFIAILEYSQQSEHDQYALLLKDH